jgi:hypothetical protein
MFYLDIIFHFGGMFVLLALIGNEYDNSRPGVIPGMSTIIIH